jgi:predicted alpha/beta superfamily hydrolase
MVLGSVLVFLYFSTSLTEGQQRDLTAEQRIYRNYQSKFLPKDRDVIVSLPAGYDKDPIRRYPVLYMHDGNSVFSIWRLDETAEYMAAHNVIEPLIIVHVDNGGTQDDRFDEYTHNRDSRGRGGNANNYGRMLVEEIKPMIDAEYRTLTDAANTGLGGASLGGLVTLYLGLKYPDKFGKLAVVSPALWRDLDGTIQRQIKNLTAKPALRIWLDIGSEEGPTNTIRQLRDLLKSKGWVLDSDLIYFEAKGSKHLEAAFAPRGAMFLKFFFPKQANQK